MAQITNPPKIQAKRPKRRPKVWPKYTPSKHMPIVTTPMIEDKIIIDTLVTATPTPTDKASIDVAIASASKATQKQLSLLQAPALTHTEKASMDKDRPIKNA